jgi:hypothetical protein
MADNRNKGLGGKKPDRKTSSSHSGDVDRFVEQQARLKPAAKPEFLGYGPNPKSRKPPSRKGIAYQMERAAALAELYKQFPMASDAASNEKKKYNEISKGLTYPFDVNESEFIQSITIQFEIYSANASLSDDDKRALADKIAKNLAAKTTREELLPTEAPALWSERKTGRGVSPADFIRSHYGSWIGKGLNREHIRKLDQKLYQALATWIARHGLPEDLSGLAPSRSDRVTSEIFEAGIKTPSDAYKMFPDDRLKAERLYKAAKRRL